MTWSIGDKFIDKVRLERTVMLTNSCGRVSLTIIKDPCKANIGLALLGYTKVNDIRDITYKEIKRITAYPENYVEKPTCPTCGQEIER